jgi:hypothetical protein
MCFELNIDKTAYLKASQRGHLRKKSTINMARIRIDIELTVKPLHQLLHLGIIRAE